MEKIKKRIHIVGGSFCYCLLRNRLEECIISTENKTVCTVRSLDLVNYLCNRGFRIKKVIDSEKNSHYKIFLFEDSKAIQKSIATYLSQKEV